jgi:hypothetical protein
MECSNPICSTFCFEVLIHAFNKRTPRPMRNEKSLRNVVGNLMYIFHSFYSPLNFKTLIRA